MLTIIYLGCGLAGLIFYTLYNMQSIKKDFEIANQSFIYSKYLQKESLSIITSIVAVVILALTIDEIIFFKPMIASYKKLLFVMWGGIGTWALGMIFGKSKKYIRDVVDCKTDIADGKVN